MRAVLGFLCISALMSSCAPTVAGFTRAVAFVAELSALESTAAKFSSLESTSASFLKSSISLGASESSGFHGCRLEMEACSASDTELNEVEHRNQGLALRMLEPATAAVVASFVASGMQESWSNVQNKLRKHQLDTNVYTLGLKPSRSTMPLPGKIAAVLPLSSSEQHCVDISRELAAKELAKELRQVAKVPKLKRVSAPDVEAALHAISERTVLEDEFPVQSVLVNDLFKVVARNAVDEIEAISRLSTASPTAGSAVSSAVSGLAAAAEVQVSTAVTSEAATSLVTAATASSAETVAVATAGASVAAATTASGTTGAAVASTATLGTAAASATSTVGATVASATTTVGASTVGASALTSAATGAVGSASVAASGTSAAVAAASGSVASTVASAATTSAASATAAASLGASSTAAASGSVASTVASAATTSAASATAAASLGASSTAAAASAASATVTASSMATAVSVGAPAAAASGQALAGNIVAAIGAVGTIPSATEVGASLGAEAVGGSFGTGVGEGLLEAGAQMAGQVGDFTDAMSQVPVCGVAAGDLQASLDVVNWEQACGVSSWLAQTQHFADAMARTSTELAHHMPHLSLEVSMPVLCFNAFALSLAALASVHALRVPEVERLQEAMYIRRLSESDSPAPAVENPRLERGVGENAGAEELRRIVEMGLSQVG